MAELSNISLLRQPYPKVLGWWDESLLGSTLGTLFILLAECGLLTRLCNSTTVDIAINGSSHGLTHLPDGEFQMWKNDQPKDAVLSILDSIDMIGKIYLCAGTSGFEALSEYLNDTHLSWPQADRHGMSSTYDTTQYVQELWRVTGRLKHLTFKADLREWSCHIIRNTFGNSPVVGLHLKQSGDYKRKSSISLANESVWLDFLTVSASQFDIQFLLLGDDAISSKIQGLPNVKLARNIGADSFYKHLSLLSECSGFFGMMSSICNTVLFSDLPYVVFKNPDHHRQEMLLEIGHKDHYPFATPYQKIIREHETLTRLLEELRIMPFATDIQLSE